MDRLFQFARALLYQTVRLYYRRIEIIDRDRIPSVGPAILVANHPNSVVDAFLLGSQLGSRKLNFIAKDAIVRAPIYGWLVRRLGVVGVARSMDYGRRRDLAHDLNQGAINACVPRLLEGEILAIFGEGISTDARHLHMVRKGAMRFGYAAERAAGFNLRLTWVPIGITYSAKQRLRSDVLIRVGQPFSLSDLDPEPALHEPRVLQLGTERLQHELESLIVNIKREELAELIDRLTDLLGSRNGRLAGRIERQQRIARAIQYFKVAEPDRLTRLDRELQRYDQQLRRACLTDDIVGQRHPTAALWTNLQGMLKYGSLTILGLYGWVNGFVPRWVAHFAAPLGSSYSEVLDTHGVRQLQVTKQALWGTVAGWSAVALAFPIQIYIVLRLAEARVSVRTAIAAAGIYALSLIPSWRLYVQQRDSLRQSALRVRDALRFLLNAGPAIKLRAQRRRLQRQLRALLRAYDAEAPLS
jgi:glycerol-3-phosphate O-acyltransferase/dihydroxyacetone phosphate acyltransferase